MLLRLLRSFNNGAALANETKQNKAKAKERIVEK